jgi:ubiquinone/menaquinone biosynthesis C-methylase UbiE
MSAVISNDRWDEAQKAELDAWINGITYPEELLRYIHEKYVFLAKVKAHCPEALIPPKERPGAALEIGIGPLRIGVVSLLEPFQAWNISGIDPMDEMSPSNIPHHIMTLYEELRNRQSLRFTKTSAETLNFDSETFDLVTCYNVLDHTQNPFAILKEIHRVLRPNGYFLLGLDALGLANWARHKAFINDICHPYKFTSWQVEWMLPRHNFELLYLEQTRYEILIRLFGKARRMTAVGRKPNK